MMIRTEIPIDAPGIDRLLRQVFDSDNEAKLVQQLREQGLLTLGMVAVSDDGEVLGYVAFSPVTLQGDDKQWLGLAPLAVASTLQKKGIGKALVLEGLNSLNEFGYAAVFVLGEAEYYQQFGFIPAHCYQLSCRWPDTSEALQIYPLDESRVIGQTGIVDYAAPFAIF